MRHYNPDHDVPVLPNTKDVPLGPMPETVLEDVAELSQPVFLDDPQTGLCGNSAALLEAPSVPSSHFEPSLLIDGNR